MYRTESRQKSERHNSHHDLYADFEKIKRAFSQTAGDVRDKTGSLITHSIDNVKGKSVKVRDNVADYTAERPFKALGIALATGLIVGLFIKR